MTKLLLLPVFAFSITSNATSWVRVTEDNIQTLYVDKDRLVKREKEVVYWTLINYKNNNISSVIKYKTVCGERKKIQLYFSYYNEPMGRGRIVSQDNWEKSYIPKPGSVKYKIMKFVCQQAEKSNL